MSGEYGDDYAQDFYSEAERRLHGAGHFECPAAHALAVKASLLITGVGEGEDGEDIELAPHRNHVADTVRGLLLLLDAQEAELTWLRARVARSAGVASGNVRREKVDHYWEDMETWTADELKRGVHATSGDVWREVAVRLNRKYLPADEENEKDKRSPDTIRNRVKKMNPDLYARVLLLNTPKKATRTG